MIYSSHGAGYQRAGRMGLLACRAALQNPGCRVLFVAAPEMRQYTGTQGEFLRFPFRVDDLLSAVARLTAPRMAA